MTTHSPSNLSETQTINPPHEIIDAQTTDSCIVGGGPAGIVLSLLLARQGIPVMLLEVHKDFDRDFRGDTIHPSVLCPLSVEWGLITQSPTHLLPLIS